MGKELTAREREKRKKETQIHLSLAVIWGRTEKKSHWDKQWGNRSEKHKNEMKFMRFISFVWAWQMEMIPSIYWGFAWDGNATREHRMHPPADRRWKPGQITIMSIKMHRNRCKFSRRQRRARMRRKTVMGNKRCMKAHKNRDEWQIN